MQRQQRNAYLVKKYGITLSDYEDKLRLQGNACALCLKSASSFKRSLHVDHNHKTGKVRGLLCFYCNHQMVRRHTKKTAAALYTYMIRFEEE